MPAGRCGVMTTRASTKVAILAMELCPMWAHGAGLWMKTMAKEHHQHTVTLLIGERLLLGLGVGRCSHHGELTLSWWNPPAALPASLETGASLLV